MSDAVEACPLAWPVGWPRTATPERSRFDTPFAAARDGVLYELSLLGARDVVMSSNLPLRRDGLPYANTSEPDDPAVAVYFTIGNETKCIPVDKWDRVRDNLHAIELTVAALRGLERWGAKEMVDAAFRGFEALPAGTGGVGWWDVLKVAPNADRETIDQAYRLLARMHHPDIGGDPEQFRRLTEAYQQARRGWA